MNNKGKVIKANWLVLVASIVLVASCTSKNEQDTSGKKATNAPIKKVEVLEVNSEFLEKNLSYSGTIIPTVSTPLSFLIPGTITSIKVDEGDEVKKGELLAELSNTSFKNAYLATQASLAQATDAYDRLKIVHDKGTLPEIQWEDIKSKLAQANAANKIALQNLSNTKLRAPSNGIIGARNTEVGATAITGIPIFNLISINKVYVRVSVPENEINLLKKEQAAKVNIPALGSHIFEGNIERIGVLANPVSKTYDIKIELSNQLLNIKPGMACDVTIALKNQDNLLAVPYSCVLQNLNAKPYVFVLNESTMTVNKKTVELGSFYNNRIVVTSGLSKGEKVVVNGQLKLSDNMQVAY